MSALLRIGPLGVAGALALAIVVAALAAPGELDPSFGVNGRVLLSPAVESYASAVAVQKDGRIVLAGTADDQAPPPPPPPAPVGPHLRNRDFLAVRLTRDGAADQAFGIGGAVRTPVDPGGQPTADGANAVAVGPDGSIVLGGYTAVPGGTDFAFARLTPSGALDSTFSGDGIQTVDVGSADDAWGVAVQPDGKIVAVGPGFTVLRLLADGQLDPRFGTGGVVQTTLRDPSLRDDAAAVLVRNGKIVVAGTADSPDFTTADFAVVRYLADGRPDPTFGDDGVAITARPGEQRAEAILAAGGGKLVAAGGSEGGFRIVRYRSDGRIDSTFGSKGVVTTAFGSRLGSYAYGIGAQADGKLVASGLGFAYDRSPFTAARYLPDGKLDPAFGVGGKAIFDQPTVQLFGGQAVIQPPTDSAKAGRLVIAGQTWEDNADHVVAVGVDLGRLEAQPPAVRCRVPRVVGLRLDAARSAIRRAHCAVGIVSHARSRRAEGLVIRQRPGPGAVKPKGARVSLVVSRGLVLVQARR